MPLAGISAGGLWVTMIPTATRAFGFWGVNTGVEPAPGGPIGRHSTAA
jgi:hypothetical protein